MPTAPMGPSEYTRMISIGGTPPGVGVGGSAPSSAGYPQMPQVGMPAMPQMPHASPPPMPGMAAPAVPQVAAPQFAAPQPAPVKAPSNNVLLYAILGLAMFVVGGLIVFLLMRH